MSGSGTDRTKSKLDLAGPLVILVEPQLGENIGMAARAMGNFALSRLRIVNPRDGWPNVSASVPPPAPTTSWIRSSCSTRVAQAVADLHAVVRHHRARP